MAKIISIILMLLGIALIVLKIFFKPVAEKIPFLANLNIMWTVVVSLILIVAGFLFLKGGRKKQAGEEVPIYQGKEIVGYRRK
jgi:uncharacterized membrane protein YqhA